MYRQLSFFQRLALDARLDQFSVLLPLLDVSTLESVVFDATLLPVAQEASNQQMQKIVSLRSTLVVSAADQPSRLTPCILGELLLPRLGTDVPIASVLARCPRPPLTRFYFRLPLRSSRPWIPTSHRAYSIQPFFLPITAMLVFALVPARCCAFVPFICSLPLHLPPCSPTFPFSPNLTLRHRHLHLTLQLGRQLHPQLRHRVHQQL
jgi:hypothetical protein